jgi:hypothetical protein
MQRRILYLVVAFLTLVFVPSAKADFIYNFTTDTAATQGGGILTITIVAPDSAVASGTISSGNITSLSLSLTSTSLPFFNTTDTSKSDLQGTFSVDITTGAFAALSSTPAVTEFVSSGGNFPTLQNENVGPIAVGSTPVLSVSDVSYSIHSAPPFGSNRLTELGSGTWTVTPPSTAVPEPSSLFLASVGSILAIGVISLRRKKRHFSPIPTAVQSSEQTCTGC